MEACEVPESEGLQVRLMEESDVAEVLRLERMIFSDAWTENNLRDNLKYPAYRSFVVRKNGLTAGYLLFMSAADEGELLRIAVNPECRRQGIAQILMDAMFDYAKQENITGIYLEVRSLNVPAQTLYGKNGFREIGIRKKYYKNPTEDAVLMSAQVLPE